MTGRRVPRDLHAAAERMDDPWQRSDAAAADYHRNKHRGPGRMTVNQQIQHYTTCIGRYTQLQKRRLDLLASGGNSKEGGPRGIVYD